MAERRVENAASVVPPRPGDRLGVAGNTAEQKYFRVNGQAGVLVEAAYRREGLDADNNRMVLRLLDDGDLRNRALLIVSLVIPSKYFLVQRKPVLKCMT